MTLTEKKKIYCYLFFFIAMLKHRHDKVHEVHAKACAHSNVYYDYAKTCAREHTHMRNTSEIVSEIFIEKCYQLLFLNAEVKTMKIPTASDKEYVTTPRDYRMFRVTYSQQSRGRTSYF